MTLHVTSTLELLLVRELQCFSVQKYRVNTTGDTGEESNGDLKDGGTLTADKNLWVLGNFSRFIRPGYKRINIEGADDMSSLLGSAWLSPDENEVVAVFVNLSYARRNVDLSMVSGETREVRTYVTDRKRDLKLDTSLQDLHNMELPARSVVTVVIGVEDATGIQEMGKGQWMMSNDDAWFDLSGRRISGKTLQSGVYIHNGLKRIIK